MLENTSQMMREDWGCRNQKILVSFKPLPFRAHRSRIECWATRCRFRNNFYTVPACNFSEEILTFTSTMLRVPKRIKMISTIHYPADRKQIIKTYQVHAWVSGRFWEVPVVKWRQRRRSMQYKRSSKSFSSAVQAKSISSLEQTHHSQAAPWPPK